MASKKQCVSWSSAPRERFRELTRKERKKKEWEREVKEAEGKKGFWDRRKELEGAEKLKKTRHNRRKYKNLFVVLLFSVEEQSNPL